MQRLAHNSCRIRIYICTYLQHVQERRDCIGAANCGCSIRVVLGGVRQRHGRLDQYDAILLGRAAEQQLHHRTDASRTCSYSFSSSGCIFQDQDVECMERILQYAYRAFVCVHSGNQQLYGAALSCLRAGAGIFLAQCCKSKCCQLLQRLFVRICLQHGDDSGNGASGACTVTVGGGLNSHSCQC